MQAGRPALIKKDGGEMLIAIVLDRPLAETKALVEAPDAFIQAITRIMQDKQNHPVITQMIRPGVSDDLLSRSLYRSHVLTTFLGPVLGAMMKQVCWHSPCHCFLMLALLRPSRRTRQNRSRQQSAASGC